MTVMHRLVMTTQLLPTEKSAVVAGELPRRSPAMLNVSDCNLLRCAVRCKRDPLPLTEIREDPAARHLELSCLHTTRHVSETRPSCCAHIYACLGYIGTTARARIFLGVGIC